VEEVLQTLHTSEQGLTSTQAAARQHREVSQTRRHQLLMTILEQVRSPLIGVYAAGAGLSLLLGAPGDFVIIGATVLANVAIGVWQEHKANRVAEALERMGTSTARILRDGHAVTVPADAVVLGDMLLLAPGDRVAADVRVVSAHGLEVDEAALTGESLPVPKEAIGGTDASRVVLEGSDVTTGTGRAVVVAVGRQTRMGATAAALSVEETEQSPLGVRLNRMLRTILPLSLAGGGIVVASGLLLRRPIAALLATGVTMMLAAIPEGLPLLASVGEAGVARRLSSRDALVRRISSVEALGRVDVACTDKTGTLTQGHLALSLVANSDQEAKVPGDLPADIRHVLLTAALASPHPDAPDAASHPTDASVIRGAQEAGLDDQLRVKHEAELAFDPVRSFYATVVQERLCVKGAPEALIPRCRWIWQQGGRYPLDEAGQHEVLAHSRRLAERGLRVLMVAQGSSTTPLDDPYDLTVLGFVGISDPLRPNVQAAVRRCRDAGVRVIMITGDHPITARTIAREAGLLEKDGEVFNATEMAELQNGELGERLEHAAVIARATPLDKLRIIESLQRQGHAVAMTGDGVNDAPALRLADVGVSMGRGGTEVARQTADVVLVEDDFSSLVETFVEGRSFWRNIRRALGLLLGGNVGELGLVVGASLLGLNFPLTVRQILAMNVITDILPATAVALQEPEHRNLAGLEREGAVALDKPLRNDVLRRAIASAGPALASYIIMLRSGLPAARTVAFACIVATQLSQTLDAGRTEENLTRSVFGAVAGSAAVLVATLTVPPLRTFLNLVMPGPLGWALIGSSALLAVILNRVLASLPMIHPAPPPLLAQPMVRLGLAT
jgi:calcium-translocating P-type ATPase